MLKHVYAKLIYTYAFMYKTQNSLTSIVLYTLIYIYLYYKYILYIYIYILI